MYGQASAFVWLLSLNQQKEGFSMKQLKHQGGGMGDSVVHAKPDMLGGRAVMVKGSYIHVAVCQ